MVRIIKRLWASVFARDRYVTIVKKIEPETELDYWR